MYNIKVNLIMKQMIENQTVVLNVHIYLSNFHQLKNHLRY